MGSCEILGIGPRCGYVAEGIRDVRLLDREAFVGLGYAEDGRVSSIRRTSDFVRLAPRHGTAQLSVDQAEEGSYTATLQLYTGGVDAETFRSLDLATRRRYVVLVLTEGGRWLLFGTEAGAALAWRVTTAEGAAAAVTLSDTAPEPPREAGPEVWAEPGYVARYLPRFEGAACWVDRNVGTPFRRAEIAPRVADPGGEALDAEGRLCAVSGRPQAILLADGAENPDPAAYEVAGRFTPGDWVDGEPTVRYDATCAAPYVYLEEWGQTEAERIVPAAGGEGELLILTNSQITIDTL